MPHSGWHPHVIIHNKAQGLTVWVLQKNLMQIHRLCCYLKEQQKYLPTFTHVAPKLNIFLSNTSILLLIWHYNCIETFTILTCVVYFDQQTGAPHAVCWSK